MSIAMWPREEEAFVGEAEVSRRLTWVGLLPLLLSVCLGPREPAKAETGYVLAVAPTEGHSGDIVLLTASGLPPHQRTAITMACPEFLDTYPRGNGDSSRYGNISSEYNGPMTDSKGDFRAFPFKVLQLHHFRSSGCTLYASYGSQNLGPYASYTILPPDQPVRRYWRRIYLSVKAIPSRVRSGFVESAHIGPSHSGYVWPGVPLDVTVLYPRGKAMHRKMHLNLKGSAWIQFHVSATVAPPVHAQIKVRARVAGWSGSQSSSFTIVH